MMNRHLRTLLEPVGVYYSLFGSLADADAAVTRSCMDETRLVDGIRQIARHFGHDTLN
jgi:hypothetical protein